MESWSIILNLTLDIFTWNKNTESHKQISDSERNSWGFFLHLNSSLHEALSVSHLTFIYMRRVGLYASTRKATCGLNGLLTVQYYLMNTNIRLEAKHYVKSMWFCSLDITDVFRQVQWSTNEKFVLISSTGCNVQVCISITYNSSCLLARWTKLIQQAAVFLGLLTRNSQASECLAA